MGSNRSGVRRVARMKRSKKEGERLARKAASQEKQPTPAGEKK
jgi:hypothetical protein